MLHKCANPACCAQFRYLHQGKLFEVEIQYVESIASNGHGKGHVERCWLCDNCAEHISLRFDRRRGLVMVSAFGSEEPLTVAVPLAMEKCAEDIARILVRPLDLELTGSIRGREASDSSVRERKTA